jgi:hypothetical protein
MQVYYLKADSGNPTIGTLEGIAPALNGAGAVAGNVTYSPGDTFGPRFTYISPSDIQEGIWTINLTFNFVGDTPVIYMKVDIDGDIIFTTPSTNMVQYFSGFTQLTGTTSYHFASGQEVGVQLYFGSSGTSGLNWFTNFTNGSANYRSYIYTTNLLPGATGHTGIQGATGHTGLQGVTGYTGTIDQNPSITSLTLTGSITNSGNATTFIADRSGTATLYTDTSTVNFPNFSGMIMITNTDTTGCVAMWLCGGGSATNIGNSSATTTGNGLVTYNSGIFGYTWTNNTSGSITMVFTVIKTWTVG